MKSRGGLGREVLEPLLLPRFYFFAPFSFLLRTAAHYLNAWNGLRELRFESPLNLIGKLTMVFFKRQSRCVLKSLNTGTGHGFQHCSVCGTG